MFRCPIARWQLFAFVVQFFANDFSSIQGFLNPFAAEFCYGSGVETCIMPKNYNYPFWCSSFCLFFSGACLSNRVTQYFFSAKVCFFHVLEAVDATRRVATAWLAAQDRLQGSKRLDRAVCLRYLRLLRVRCKNIDVFHPLQTRVRGARVSCCLLNSTEIHSRDLAIWSMSLLVFPRFFLYPIPRITPFLI